ncbi:OmpP1/FadL family transporter [Pantoea sp. At-9b]|uniref:OmpP1/FadL family transporter n=1 Tax=Pantoea sp. (strain At-9b) TaxID=592316 RepID=UPI0001B3FBA7|nr:outer membrane protein transport protein [Pantoea sp. At-9b]ADU71663.1 membrane protein involved in aromatic hydrocarbon degradation [Pantoea sp. At-9b]
MWRINLSLCCLLLSGASQASGLYLYEIATEDIGLAGAGQAARAQDAATLMTNPAGMTRLPDRMITGGLQALYGDTPYSLDNDATLRGNSPGNTIGWFPGASLFYHQRLNDRWSAGIGLYGNYGLGLDFGDWAGDRLIKKSTLVGMTLSPAIAWKINDRLSWGLGLGINYGFLSLTRNLDGQDEKATDHDWALNFRTGLLMQVTDATRIGLAYTSKTEYHFTINGEAQFPQLDNVSYTLPIDAQVNTPAQLMFSVVHDLNQQWSLLGDLGWQDWSAYGANQIAVTGQALSRDNKLQDTWHTAFGVQFRPDEQWRFNAGIAYDSSFYKNQDDTSLTMPSGAAWRYGIGAQYQLTASSNIGAAFEYLNMASSSVATPLVKGDYHDPNIYFFSMNYSYQF